MFLMVNILFQISTNPFQSLKQKSFLSFREVCQIIFNLFKVQRVIIYILQITVIRKNKSNNMKKTEI